MALTFSKDGKTIKVQVPLMVTLLPVVAAGVTAGVCFTSENPPKRTWLYALIAGGVGLIPVAIVIANNRSKGFRELADKETDSKVETIDAVATDVTNIPASPSVTYSDNAAFPSGGAAEVVNSSIEDILDLIVFSLETEEQKTGFIQKADYFADQLKPLNQATLNGVFKMLYTFSEFTPPETEEDANAAEKVISALITAYSEETYNFTANFQMEVAKAIGAFVDANCNPGYEDPILTSANDLTLVPSANDGTVEMSNAMVVDNDNLVLDETPSEKTDSANDLLLPTTTAIAATQPPVSAPKTNTEVDAANSLPETKVSADLPSQTPPPPRKVDADLSLNVPPNANNPKSEKLSNGLTATPSRNPKQEAKVLAKIAKIADDTTEDDGKLASKGWSRSQAEKDGTLKKGKVGFRKQQRYGKN